MEADLGKKLEALLNSPEGLAKISDAMAALGMGETASASPPTPAPDPDPSPDLSGLLKLMPLFSSFDKDDEHTALLKALRPYVHGEREKRLDESVKLMQLLKVLPLLQERGLFK